MVVSEEHLELLQKLFKRAYLEGYKDGKADLQFEIETGYPKDQYMKAKKIVDKMFGYS